MKTVRGVSRHSPDTSRPTEPAGENGNLPPVLINRITDRNISITHKPKHRKE